MLDNPRLEFFQRLVIELGLFKDLPSEIQCWNDDDQLETFTAIMSGPPDTPYKGGKFTLKINIPREYPVYPPMVRFFTRVYHPNIDDHGRICLDLLKSKPNGSWNSTYNINTVLKGIYLLLSTPNADDPLDSEAAAQYKNFRSEYFSKAEKFTKKYAIENAQYEVRLDPITARSQTSSTGNSVTRVTREEIKPLPKFSDLIKSRTTKSNPTQDKNGTSVSSQKSTETTQVPNKAPKVDQTESSVPKSQEVRIKKEPTNETITSISHFTAGPSPHIVPKPKAVKNEPESPTILSIQPEIPPISSNAFSNSLTPPITSNFQGIKAVNSETGNTPVAMTSLASCVTDQSFSFDHIRENRSMLSSENSNLSKLDNLKIVNSVEKLDPVIEKPLNLQANHNSFPSAGQITSRFFGAKQTTPVLHNSSKLSEVTHLSSNGSSIHAVKTAFPGSISPVQSQGTTPVAVSRPIKRPIAEVFESTSTTSSVPPANAPMNSKKFASKKDYFKYLDELYPLSKQVRIPPLAVENDPYLEGYDPKKYVIPEVKPKLENLSKAAIKKYSEEMKAYRAGTWKPQEE